MNRRRLPRPAAAAATVLLAATACIPYTVGSTAQTVPAREITRTTTYYYIPNAFKTPEDSVGTPMPGAEAEFRFGVDARSDVGLRIVPIGAVVNYKRRLGADTSHTRAATALMGGAGIVNSGEHAHLEATLIRSGSQVGTVTPYGGVRAMQVIPLGADAVSDSPTLGVFGGMRLGNERFTLVPELGVFYDRPALGLRSASVIFVPSLTLQRGSPRNGRGRLWP